MKDYRQIITGEEEVSLHFRTTYNFISQCLYPKHNTIPMPRVWWGTGSLSPTPASWCPPSASSSGRGWRPPSRVTVSSITHGMYDIHDIHHSDHDNDHDLMTLVQVSAWRGRLSCWAAPPRSWPSTYWAASTGSTPATCTRSAHHHDNMMNIQGVP